MCNGDAGCAYILPYSTPQLTLFIITSVKYLNVGKEHASEKWTDLLGWHSGEVTINEEGWAEFRCPARSVSIWTKTDACGREEFKEH
jgi:hypothetical protein